MQAPNAIRPALKRISVCAFALKFVFLFISTTGCARTAHQNDTPATKSYTYPFLHPELNYIQFHDRAALQAFYEKWVGKKDRLITIAHFGDSHVQPDIYPGALRQKLQAEKGKAGFGMMFPFSTAKTYSMRDYRSTHTGVWKSANSIHAAPALPLGISGATSRTNDSTASFTLTFRDSLPAEYRKLKIFCRKDAASYDVLVRTGNAEVPVHIAGDSNPAPYIEVSLPELGKTLTVQLHKTDAAQKEFEFYGMSLESIDSQGVMLHCLGIGGAQYCAPLKQMLFDVQLPAVQPDLVILDYGTNDYVYKNTVPAALEGQILQVIQKVRKAAPDATILLTSAMDMVRKGRSITAGMTFSELIRKIAREQNCPYYDWYWISGGPYVMPQWQANGLATKDMVHLSSKGYTLKGEMLADAMLNTLNIMASESRPDSLVLDVPAPIDTANAILIVRPEEGNRGGEKKVVSARKKAATSITHTVKQGETIFGIAKRYKVSVKQVQKLNGKRSMTIRAGEKLKVK